MAARVKIYPLIKAVHRYTGLGLVVFITIYFFSGFIMTHLPWFEGEQKPAVEKRLRFSIPREMNLSAIGVMLQDSFDLNGYRQPPKMRDDSTVQFEFYHPGTFQSATVDLKEEILLIRIQDQNFAQVFNGLHRIHGYGGGWVYDVFVFMMDMTSMALVLFVLSGVYLWLKVVRNKVLGWCLLGLSVIYAAVVIVTFMA